MSEFKNNWKDYLAVSGLLFLGFLGQAMMMIGASGYSRQLEEERKITEVKKVKIEKPNSELSRTLANSAKLLMRVGSSHDAT